METLSAFEKTVLEILKNDVEEARLQAHHPSLDVLLDYLDGALPLQERALVDAHTLRCPHCRQQLEALAEGVAERVRDLCGQAPTWSFASWLAQRGHRVGVARRPFWRSAKLVWALGGAAVVGCLGTATWDVLTLSSRLVARGEAAGGVATRAIGLFIAAGLLMVAGLAALNLRRRRR